MKILVLPLIIYLFIGCSQKEVSNDSNQSNNNKNQQYKKGKRTKLAPPWVTNPNLGVKYGTVGIAHKQKNIRLQRLSAIANGKRKLSELFRTQLQQQTPAPLTTNSRMIGSTFNIVALKSSQDITKNVTIKDSYTSDDGTLYVWVVIY